MFIFSRIMILNTPQNWQRNGLKTRILGFLYGLHNLNEHETPPKGIHELWERVEKEWEGISADVCQNLIASMPRRVSAVIQAKGGYTKY